MLAVIRRRLGFVIAAGILGVAAATGLLLHRPPLLNSTTLVLLPPPAAGQQSGADIDTQVRIVTSTTVLGQAGQVVRPALSARAMQSRVDVTAPTTQLIEIEAAAPVGQDAQALAGAVAEGYVAYAEETAHTVTSSALGDLYARQKDLKGQVTALQGEISATLKRQASAPQDSPDAKREAQLLAQLRAEQADISLQLDKVKDDIAGSDAVGAAAGKPSVIQAPSPPTGDSLVQRLLVWGPLAFLFTSGLAAVAFLLTARRDTRLRLRNEIADALGSPVLAGVQSRPQRSVAGWSVLLESYEPRPVDAWAFRQLMRALVPVDGQVRSDQRHFGRVEHPRALTVVSLAGDARGLAIGPQLAGFAASIGIVTRLVASRENDSAASLWSAFTAERTSTPRPGLVLGQAHPDTLVDLTITLVVVDRRRPVIADPDSPSAMMLSLGAGAATEEELARVAVAVDDSDQRIDGIVLADPDRSDRTSGRHTMDERALQPSLPARLTGVVDGRRPDRRRTGL